jgi:hypothetical protein
MKPRNPLIDASGRLASSVEPRGNPMAHSPGADRSSAEELLLLCPGASSVASSLAISGNRAVERLLRSDEAVSLQRDVIDVGSLDERQQLPTGERIDHVLSEPALGRVDTDVPQNMTRPGVTRVPPIGVAVEDAPQGGVVVTAVEQDQPAALVLQEGDVLVAVDLMELAGAEHLQQAVAAKEPGNLIVLHYVPGDAEVSIGADAAPTDGQIGDLGDIEAGGRTAAVTDGISLAATGRPHPAPAPPFPIPVPAPPPRVVVLPVQPKQPSTPKVSVADLRGWPATLDSVKRGPGKAPNIGKVQGALALTNTNLGMSTPLSAQQQAIVEEIKSRRASVRRTGKLVEHAGGAGRKADSKAGYSYGGSTAGPQIRNPETDVKRQNVWNAIAAEIGGGEGRVSGVATYDRATVSLGGGLSYSLLSKAMEDFFAHDGDAENEFLDIGVSFKGGKLLVVNTDNGGIEIDDMAETSATFNARQIMAISEPILDLYIRLAEDPAHGQNLADAQVRAAPAFQFPTSVALGWTDMMSVRLVAHCINSNGSAGWGSYASATQKGDIRTIVKVFADQAGAAKRNPDKGDARVMDQDTTANLLGFAAGTVRTRALDSPISAPLPSPIAPHSMVNVLLLTDPKDGTGTHFFTITLLSTP